MQWSCGPCLNILSWKKHQQVQKGIRQTVGGWVCENLPNMMMQVPTLSSESLQAGTFLGAGWIRQGKNYSVYTPFLVGIFRLNSVVLIVILPSEPVISSNGSAKP